MKKIPRADERFFLSFYLRVFEDSRFIGFLVDISDNGFKLMSEFPLTVEKKYKIMMKLPHKISQAENQDYNYINFDAFCRWTEQDELDREFNLNGLEFIDIDIESKKWLKQLIIQFKVKQKS